MSTEPPPMKAPDQEVRDQALDRRQSLILEAPAGSGKTGLLTARFLALLADVRHPRQILAVTFTRKAAAEMADRITGTLRQALAEHPAPPATPWDALLLDLARAALRAHPDWTLLMRSPDAFFVDTFHGFCARIARQWPLESEVPPGFALLDDLGQQALLDTAVREYIQAAAAGESALDPYEAQAFQRRLAAANNNVRALGGQLADLLARRDRLDGLIAVFRQAQPRAELESRAERLAGLGLAPLRAYFAGQADAWRELAARLHAASGVFADRLAPEPPGMALQDAPAWRAAAEVFLTKTGTPRRQFRPAEFGPQFGKGPLADWIAGLPPDIAERLAELRGWPDIADPVGYEALRDFVLIARGVLARFAALLRARGLDFMELELAALRAFSRVDRPGESLVFFHEHLRHVLVDEAQDMNDTQVRILGALAEGWEADDGRTVFVVGDPKQSIFRFRRADVSLFESLKAGGLPRRGEAPLPLRPLALRANFRSRPHLVAFANAAFAHILGTPRPEFDEVAFQPAAPARASAPVPAPVTLAVFSCRTGRTAAASSGLPSGEARIVEARYVADRIAALHRERPDDTIAVLMPARTHLTPYVRALAAYALPVRLMEGVPMPDCPEVRHLLNLFRALVRPHDDVAWAAVLRAPWCRVPEAVLERIAAAPGLARWSDRIAGPCRDAHPDLARFQAAWDRLRPDVGREPYAVSLQRLWEDLDGPAAVVRRYGSAGLAGALQALELLGRCPPGTAEDTLEAFERLVAHAYTPPDPRAAFSPIAVMTIHRAKGLEFDHVFAVGLDRRPGGRTRGEWQTAFLLDRLPVSGRPFLAAAGGDRRTEARPLAHVLLQALGRRRDAAEYRRLVYVAATRARESLTLSGLWKARPSDPDGEEDAAAAAAESPIAWFEALARQRAFEGLPVRLLRDPRPDAPVPAAAAAPVRLPDPAPFDPAPLPYRIETPSALEDATAMVALPGTDEPDPEARARGVVMHRVFDTLARGSPAPDTAAVEAALAAEGVVPAGRPDLARAALVECRRAWDLPAFASLRQAASAVLCEWALEDAPAPGRLRVGRVDLLLKTGEGAVLVDFKTGRPGPRADPGDWLVRETARYRPQLDAYREMAARVLGLEPGRVRRALLFTALPQWVEVP